VFFSHFFPPLPAFLVFIRAFRNVGFLVFCSDVFFFAPPDAWQPPTSTFRLGKDFSPHLIVQFTFKPLGGVVNCLSCQHLASILPGLLVSKLLLGYRSFRKFPSRVTAYSLAPIGEGLLYPCLSLPGHPCKMCPWGTPRSPDAPGNTSP